MPTTTKANSAMPAAILLGFLIVAPMTFIILYATSINYYDTAVCNVTEPSGFGTTWTWGPVPYNKLDEYVDIEYTWHKKLLYTDEYKQQVLLGNDSNLFSLVCWRP